MDKIVGNIVFIFCMMAHTIIVQAQVELRIRDRHGRSTQKVAVGYPFTLEVILDGEHSAARNPTIERLQAFSSGGRQTRIQTVNGKTTAMYMYTMTANKPGKYEIGPASIIHNGQKISSEPVTVTVVNESPEQTRDNDNEIAPVIVRLVANKTRVVQGEGIRFGLQLLRHDEQAIVREMRQPQWPGCTIEGPFEGQKRIEKVDGVPYQLAEWVWYVYPTKQGRLVVPAIATDYQLPLDQNDNQFGHFSFFFRQQYKNKRVYSNPITIEVDPVPAYDGVVNAIGSFSHFHAELNPPIAKEGEGMVLVLSVERTGASDAIKAPQLMGIPDSLRSYESKQYSVDHKDGSYADYFEYIIQGMKPGLWEIPAQQFTFFDVEARRYATIHTQSVEATITPSAQRKKDTMQASDHNISDNESEGTIQDDHDIRQLCQQGPWNSAREWELPLWLFMVLLSVPMVGLLGVFIGKRMSHYRVRRMPFVNQKRAFIRARSALQLAEQNKAPQDIYVIFTRLFADRLLLSDTHHLSDIVVQRLVRGGMTSYEIDQWGMFFAHIEELHFFKRTAQRHDDAEIFKNAYDWLAILEKIL